MYTTYVDSRSFQCTILQLLYFLIDYKKNYFYKLGEYNLRTDSNRYPIRSVETEKPKLIGKYLHQSALNAIYRDKNFYHKSDYGLLFIELTTRLFKGRYFNQNTGSQYDIGLIHKSFDFKQEANYFKIYIVKQKVNKFYSDKDTFTMYYYHMSRLSIYELKFETQLKNKLELQNDNCGNQLKVLNKIIVVYCMQSGAISIYKN